ncbi:uncharacterized protein TRAVEDRAFT_68154 [Trametes versicolor FP-101664 SS1]|uniref:uncharacterized protein n=1 Tax=Trametes versicolor (strain FP-101664) TaxID=717944 RepID=UPI00046237A0|nr:uncharacterized protein TRAVEDRAFT_68154 [Trametes versicolor FP-101664 SS1]EIW64316.1 hypothetical protein TRAVEDRAFT_68154 [Trametes versicolor FP-101664 SS1]
MSPTATTETHEHIPTVLNPHELSRSSSPQQSNLSLLVSNGHAALRSPPAGVAQSPPASHAHPPPHSEPAVSIQSILSNAPPSAPTTNGHQSSWNGTNASSRDPSNAVAGPSTGASPEQPASRKRKLDPAEAVDPHSKIRRVVRDHITQDPARVMPMTTVICLHAAVAQKSYGSEKRFLCPPPVVHIEGPVWQMKQQSLSMAVVNEGGERTCELKAPMDHNLTASFKFLHVTGSAKSKNFLLSLDIAEPAADGSDANERIWASFDSAPVTIISKPSKKTAKTRNISSCILAGGPVSLFNRINSQTVRTKYMTIEQNQLCASNVAWSAFAVNVVRPQGAEAPLGGPQPVTYGSEIVLADTVTGVQTAPLIIRKVDKGRIVNDDGGPVSQMQKIALQRLNSDGTRHYLSAAGPIAGTPGVSAPSAPGLSNQAGTHPLLFQSPRVREEVKDGARVITDEVDDYLCWTIVGISKFQYTFFDAFGLNNNVPELPITPFPTLFNTPVYRSQSNTLEMTAANFFYEHPKTRHQVPLDVYIGNIGPLRLRLYNHAATNQDNPFNPRQTFLPVPNNPDKPDDLMVAMNTEEDRRYNSLAAALNRNIHALIVVEMPPVADIIKALREDAVPPPGEAAADSSQSDPSGQRTGDLVRDIAGRSLPLLFIRSYDGVGYHSGRVVAADNVLHAMDLSNPVRPTGEHGDWLAAAQAAARLSDETMHGWNLKVL